MIGIIFYIEIVLLFYQRKENLDLAHLIITQNEQD